MICVYGVAPAMPFRFSRPIKPGLCRSLGIVCISACQQNPPILQPRFGHEVPGLLHLAIRDNKLCSRRVEDFRLLASACDEQSPFAKLSGFVRKFEAAVI